MKLTRQARRRLAREAAVSFALAIATLLMALALVASPVHAAPDAYTCRWTVNHGTTPKTAIVRCTNGYTRAYVWSARYGRWIPTKTVEN